MNLRRILRLTLSVCALFFFCASIASAEETANSAEHATELFKWINFAIVAIVILWVFGKVLPSKFRANAETIGSEITKAAAIKAEADRVLVDAESRLARLEQEVAELRANAQKEAAADAERIREMAKSDAEKISVAAKAEIEAAERAARVELKALAAKLAVDGAESLLAKQLTAQAQESLVGGFVKSLEGRPN
jgi:F0F1-type ATP synthase membrane subunit b/b'